MNIAWELLSRGATATRNLGRLFGQEARPGDALFLCGELGAGKTCFAQGVAAGLNVPKEVPVTSPSYTLLNPYPGRLELFHFDLYRLTDVEDLDDVGFDDCLYGDGVTLVEWIDRFPALQPDGVYLTLTYGRTIDERQLSCRAKGNAACEWQQRVRLIWPEQEEDHEGI
jgi:tRNA threonylcarbamoyladenosine biosynthesis protein TsaE